MRTWRAFMAALVVAFVVLSALADSGPTERVVTGTVAEFQAGEWMLVTNEAMSLPVALGETTAYEGRDQDSALDPAAIKPGVRVTVWYRSVGERRPRRQSARAPRPGDTLSFACHLLI